MRGAGGSAAQFTPAAQAEITVSFGADSDWQPSAQCAIKGLFKPAYTHTERQTSTDTHMCSLTCRFVYVLL